MLFSSLKKGQDHSLANCFRGKSERLCSTTTPLNCTGSHITYISQLSTRILFSLVHDSKGRNIPKSHEHVNQKTFFRKKICWAPSVKKSILFSHLDASPISCSSVLIIPVVYSSLNVFERRIFPRPKPKANYQFFQFPTTRTV